MALDESTAVKPLRFEGHAALAHRLVLATLTGRTILVSKIRPNNPTSPGLAPHEVSFLRLLESVTNGSAIEFSYTGTRLLYKPGLITGCAGGGGYGASSDGVLRHELPADNARGVSYFLLPLCMLAPFAKNPVNVVFHGPGVITGATPTGDVSADTVRTAVLPLYAHFGVQVKLELRINRRSGPGRSGRGGGGEVQLVFGQQVRLPKTLHLMVPGRVKSVRGVAYSVGVSGSNNARMIEAARGLLNPLVPDTYIFGDVSAAPRRQQQQQQGGKAGDTRREPQDHRRTPDDKIGVGFGLSLVATTSAGCIFSADVASPPHGGVAAEDVGRHCALQLLENVSKGGCVEALGLPTVLTLMALGSEDVGRVRLGKEVLATAAGVGAARDLERFGLNRLSLRDVPSGGSDKDNNDDDEEAAEREVIAVMKGRGIGNVGRKIA